MRRRLFLRLVAACLLPALLALPCVLFAACATPPTTLAAAPTDDENLADYLRAAFAEEQPCIPLADFGGLTEATLERVYAHLLATDPSLFFVTPTYTLSCRAEGDETVPVSLTPTYRYRGAALAAARADFAERVSAYLADLPRGAAPLARVADLHDRMILDFDYDESEEVVDPYTLLVGGRGVCQAYSLLFTVLCRAAGVAAEPVTCFDRSHAWNQIEIDGDWYHVDLTWDETALPYPGRVPHTYFLLTDRELAARRSLDDTAWEGAVWDAPHACDGRSLSGLGLWTSAGRMATLDGETLYYAAVGAVWALDCRTVTRRRVLRDENAPAGVSLSVLCPDGGRILCNLARALLTITPDAAGGESLSLSHELAEGEGVYAGLSLTPGGYPLLATVAYPN